MQLRSSGPGRLRIRALTLRIPWANPWTRRPTLRFGERCPLRVLRAALRVLGPEPPRFGGLMLFRGLLFRRPVPLDRATRLVSSSHRGRPEFHASTLLRSTRTCSHFPADAAFRSASYLLGRISKLLRGPRFT